MKLCIISGICFLLFGLIYSCQSESSIEFNRYYADGAIVYETHCQNCHGSKGEGLGALIPPLTDAAYLKTNRALLACDIKYGLKAKITIANKQFDDEMPADNLSPIEIAQALTYTANSFGNKLGLINDDEVNAGLGKCGQ
jgi:mono/diheme cytochrome c family protein